LSATSVRVRPARRSDAPAIVAMLGRLAAFERATRPPRLNVETLCRDAFGATRRFRVFIAERGNTGVVGFATLFDTYSSWEGARCAHIGDLWVEPRARRDGAGRALMGAIVRHVARTGALRVDLYVLRTNDARAFYERLGFRHESRWLVYRLEKDRFPLALSDYCGAVP